MCRISARTTLVFAPKVDISDFWVLFLKKVFPNGGTLAQLGPMGPPWAPWAPWGPWGPWAHGPHGPQVPPGPPWGAPGPPRGALGVPRAPLGSPGPLIPVDPIDPIGYILYILYCGSSLIWPIGPFFGTVGRLGQGVGDGTILANFDKLIETREMVK